MNIFRDTRLFLDIFDYVAGQYVYIKGGHSSAKYISRYNNIVWKFEDSGQEHSFYMKVDHWPLQLHSEGVMQMKLENHFMIQFSFEISSFDSNGRIAGLKPVPRPFDYAFSVELHPYTSEADIEHLLTMMKLVGVTGFYVDGNRGDIWRRWTLSDAEKRLLNCKS